MQINRVSSAEEMLPLQANLPSYISCCLYAVSKRPNTSSEKETKDRHCATDSIDVGSISIGYSNHLGSGGYLFAIFVI